MNIYLSIIFLKIYTGMTTAIFSFIPTVFLIFLLKHTRSRELKLNKKHLKSKRIELIKVKREICQKSKRNKLILPWWLKIIEYLLSYFLMTCSMFFTYVKGFILFYYLNFECQLVKFNF